MRTGYGGARGIAIAALLLLAFIALYITPQAWADEKSQMDNQLAMTRSETSKVVAHAEARAQDAEAANAKLQTQVQDLQDRLARSDIEMTAAKAKLQEATTEQVKLRGRVTELSGPPRPKAIPNLGDGWDGVGKVSVWVWWDFPNGVPTGIRLNVRTWMVHLNPDKFDLRFVNKTNIRALVPDLPEAFYRMYPLAQSDFVRAAMLALHGGVYMDGDMMLRQDLDVTFRDIFEGRAEVVPYLWENQECRKSFSTNFMAGRKGNALSVGWLKRIYKLMDTKCDEGLGKSDDGSYEFYRDIGCCLLPNGKPRPKCYVSFGLFGDKAAHFLMRNIDDDKQKNRPKLKMTCINKWQGMAANASGSCGELLWKKLLPGPPEGYKGPIGVWGKVPKREQKLEVCWREGPEDLRCSQSVLYPHFFERAGYHLFNLCNNDLISGFQTEEELINSGAVIGECLKLALAGEKNPEPRYLALKLKPKHVGEEDRAKNKWWGDVREYKMAWLRQ